MIINNHEVKREEKKKKNTEGEVVSYFQYEYFACTCKEDDLNFYESLISNSYPDANKGFYSNKRSSYFLNKLNKLGWYFTGAGTDMWMGIYLKNKGDDSLVMRLECDAIEYGLVSALLIAEDLRS